MKKFSFYFLLFSIFFILGIGCSLQKNLPNINLSLPIDIKIEAETPKEIIIKKDEAYVQGIILKYYTTNDEVKETRKGGIGSTNKEEK